MAIGWRDNKGRFYPVPGAKAGEFRRVETGFGLCSIKMVDEFDPGHQPPAHKLKIVAHDEGMGGECDCGKWGCVLPDYAFPIAKKARAEIERRHAYHKKAEQL